MRSDRSRSGRVAPLKLGPREVYGTGPGQSVIAVWWSSTEVYAWAPGFAYSTCYSADHHRAFILRARAPRCQVG
jgi:hypothetical protein